MEIKHGAAELLPYDMVKALGPLLPWCCSCPPSRGQQGPAPQSRTPRAAGPIRAGSSGAAWLQPEETACRRAPCEGSIFFSQHKYDKTSLPFTQLHWLHCCLVILRSWSEYVQIEESSTAEAQTRNCILWERLKKSGQTAIFPGISKANLDWTQICSGP